MINTGKLAGKTLFITGGSRGIGKEIALKAARDGANVVIAAKTTEPHPKLPGTIYTAVKEIEEAGGKGLACAVDIRYENQVVAAVEAAVKMFGGIDILVNNASAISLTGVEHTDMKKYDLMNNINTRGTFLVSKTCIPYLKKSSHAHILNLSPPLNMNPLWFGSHVAYTIAKYGMSMCVLGMQEELKPYNIAVNALWPKTAISTAALHMLIGEEESLKYGRTPDIIADAAYYIFTKEPKPNGNFYIDEEVLKEAGITNFDQYHAYPEYKHVVRTDIFVDIEDEHKTDTPAVEENKVGNIFKSFESQFNAETIEKFKCIYQFNLSGEQAGSWFLNLKTAPGSWGMGESPASPDIILSMDSKHFFSIFSGKLKPTAAFMTGKLKIKGDMKMAMKLDKFLSNLKSKL
ncbi:hypothetical protein FQR65_LT13195 [Abscondita terminalis]|nr:hypothetical protein FQR65_LT13195 [Abscondita terminalis]